jgi:transcription antitermination factor NusG
MSSRPGGGAGNGSVREKKTLLLDLTSISPGAAWHCLHTLSRREKKVAADCAALEIPYFLPLRKSIRRHNGRNYTFDVPLFSGYLFCAVTQEQRRRLLNTRNLAQTIAVPDQESLLEDLRQIENAIRCEADLEPFPFLKRGARVRIADGPFQGIEGIVSERRKKFRVILNVRMLHQAVALEVDGGAIKPL